MLKLYLPKIAFYGNITNKIFEERPSMTQEKIKNEIYILETGEQAGKRLDHQHRIFSKNSYEHLINAGISEGKVVWDVGCGSGAMTEYIAKIVGKTGHVYAMDASDKQLQVTKNRLEQAGLDNVTYIHMDINSAEFNPPINGADIVYSRFFLMHMQNPEIVIGKMKTLLKSGGTLALEEPIWNASYVSENNEIFKNYMKAGVTFGESKNLNFNLGLELKSILEKMNFAKVEVEHKEVKLSAIDTKQQIIPSIDEWTPKAIQAGIITIEDVTNWKEMFFNISDENESFACLLAQSYALAWDIE